MRLRAVVAALALLLPAVASAATPVAGGPGSPAECARLHKQIRHFEGMAERAEAQGSALWTQRMQLHIDRLKGQQELRCPEDAEDSAAKAALVAFMNLLKLAGKAAVTYFTFGAF